jgi:low temperature requirement protein LtrA
MRVASRKNQLRTRGGHARVTFIELFYDLVYVFAVTQLSHGLLAHLTPLGALQTGLLMLAVWWAWINTAWVTNWLDPDKPTVRTLLFALMLAGLVLSASIPKAFEDRALTFALAYAAMQACRDIFMLWSLKRHDHGNYRNFLRISVWHAVTIPLWIAGAFVDAQSRLVLWAIAVGLETVAPIAGYWNPVLGRSTTADWTVEGAHMAERCGLFVIIALGESILITGATFAELEWSTTAIAAFVVAFAGSVAMWAVYFNIGADRASTQAASSADPGRIARSGYTYLHILIIAAIIITAVGDELVLHHPEGHHGHIDVATAAVIIGGPALYLVGNGLFKWLTAPYFPLSHIAGLAVLAICALAAMFLTPLVLSAATTATLVGVVIWERLSLGAPTVAEAHSGDATH